MNSKTANDTVFLQWALPRMGYRWEGFRKPRQQVVKRIENRMRELELRGGFDEYKQYLKQHPEEWKALDRLCDVTISKFFRDRKVWDFLRDHILDKLLLSDGPDSVSIWSAGCCNGEEPYSIAIIIEQLSRRNLPANTVSILATDRNQEVLERAKEGRYPAGSLKELTDKEIGRFLHRVEDDEDDYIIRKELSRRVVFEWRDIRNSLPEGTFDLVFCRNLVFTYFEKEEQLRFLERLESHIAGNGYLVTGSNETVPKVEWLKTVTDTHPVYQKNK